MYVKIYEYIQYFKFPDYKETIKSRLAHCRMNFLNKSSYGIHDILFCLWRDFEILWFIVVGIYKLVIFRR